jgi:uncharacterized protein (TIGR02271 family)
MNRRQAVTVVTRNGKRGTIDTTSRTDDDQVVIHMEDGQHVLVPVALLSERDDGTYYLPAELVQLEDDKAGDVERLVMVIPVLAEELEVEKRRVAHGGVRVQKKVHEREVVIDEPLFEEDIQIERVAVNEFVDEPPLARREGDTLVIPLLEEVTVVEKRLMVREELRITKERKNVRHPERVTLRSEEAVVERIDIEPAE